MAWEGYAPHCSERKSAVYLKLQQSRQIATSQAGRPGVRDRVPRSRELRKVTDAKGIMSEVNVWLRYKRVIASAGRSCRRSGDRISWWTKPATEFIAKALACFVAKRLRACW